MINSIDIKVIRKNSASKNTIELPGKTDSGFWRILNSDLTFNSRLSDKIKENIYLELSVLLEAGVDIRSSLQLIKDNQAKVRDKKIIDVLLKMLVSGSSFSDSLEHTKSFTAYESLSIKIGEETGKLIYVLKELAYYFKKKIKQRRQIVGALTYPGIVLSVAFSAIIFMVSYVVPMFSDVFKRFGGDLPYPTKLVLSISKFLREYIIICLLIFTTIVFILFKFRKSIKYRSVSSFILLKIPVLKSLICKIYLARFSNTMSLLISSRISILKSLEMCREIIGFYPIEVSLVQIKVHVTEGMPLHDALSKHSIFPAKMISMIKVGEDVNQLELFFSKLADQYNEDIEYQTGLLSKAMEPIIIILLGLIIGAVLIAMYLPLFKLGQGF